MVGLPSAVMARLRRLPEGLRDHIHRVRRIARDLAELCGVDARSADLGAAAHDPARATQGSVLLEEARR